MAMFYEKSHIEQFLHNNMDNALITYFQEYLKINFVNTVRSQLSITNDTIEQIKNISRYCGCTSEFKISDYIAFLVKIFTKDPIEIKIIQLIPNSATAKVRQLVQDDITEIPKLLIIHIDRQGSNSLIDIQKKIMPNDNIYHSNQLVFHSVICFNANLKRYYGLLKINNRWYIYDNKKTPCLYETDRKNKELNDSIKRECIIIFYKLN